MKTIKMHLVPTFHHDIAYLRPEKDFTAAAVRITDRAMELLEQNPDYTYTIEQAYFFEEYWNTHPEKQDLIRDFVRQGRLFFSPGFFAVPDMCMPDGESLFMTASFGRKILRALCGAEPRCAYVADSWGHHAQLPQILSQCGYTSYAFSRCMTRNLDRENFRWQGLDGTILNTHWFSTGYAGLSFPDQAPQVNAEELHWEDVSGIGKLYERNRERCGDAAQFVPVGGDMKMPALSAPGIVRELQKNDKIPYPAFSSFENASDAVDFGKEPVFRGEFLSCFKGSFSTNIQIKLNNRALENGLYDTEVLSVLKGKPADLTPVWRATLKNQFHDILCGTVCDDGYTQALDEQAQALEQLEQIRTQLCPGERNGYLNTLPFARDELQNGIRMVAKGFSPARTSKLSESPEALPAVFENDFYRAKINERGSVTELIEKKTEKTLVQTDRVPFGALVLEADSGDNWVEFEYPWEYDPSRYDANLPDPLDRSRLPVHPKVRLSLYGVQSAEAVRLEDGSLVVTQKGSLNYWQTRMPFTTRMTLNAHGPRIDYHTEFTCSNRRLRLRAAFPLAFREYKVRHQIPFGIVERGEGTQPLSYFMDTEGADAGLALLNRGLPANNTEEGVMLLTLFRSVAMEYKCQSELSYNLGRNFAVDYAVLPHSAGEDVLLWQQAQSFQHPFLRTDDGPLMTPEVEGAFLSAMRYDEGDLFLRVFNGTDKDTCARIRLPEGFRLLARTDGNMDPTEPFAPCGGEAESPLGPFRIQGIKFRS